MANLRERQFARERGAMVMIAGLRERTQAASFAEQKKAWGRRQETHRKIRQRSNRGEKERRAQPAAEVTRQKL